jgi:Ser/Thr protein kinase RdoA (MazF antagonist)
MIEATSHPQLAELAETAMRALSHYDLSGDPTVELISLSENAVYRVTDGTRESILRLHRSGYVVRQEIASELAWTMLLRSRGFPTAAVIPSHSGESVLTLHSAPLADERHCVLFERLPGEELLEADFLRWSGVVGTLTAELHEATLACDLPSWFRRPRWTTDTIVGEMARWGRWQDGFPLSGAELQLLARAAGAATERLKRLGHHEQDFGLVHADLRPANLLLSEGSLTTIDFDDAGWSWYLWELAGYLRGQQAHPSLGEAIARWLAGYRSVRGVSAEAEATIPSMLVMRRLQGLGWLGSHGKTDLARSMHRNYLRATCDVAEAYLSRGRWFDA